MLDLPIAPDRIVSFGHLKSRATPRLQPSLPFRTDYDATLLLQSGKPSPIQPTFTCVFRTFVVHIHTRKQNTHTDKINKI